MNIKNNIDGATYRFVNPMSTKMFYAITQHYYGNTYSKSDIDLDAIERTNIAESFHKLYAKG